MNALPRQSFNNTLIQPLEDYIGSSDEERYELRGVYAEIDKTCSALQAQGRQLTTLLENPTSESEFKPVQKPEFYALSPGAFRWMNILQTWKGRITSVRLDENEFTAIICDQTNKSNPDEEVVMDMSAIHQGDRSLVEEGAVFYWNVGQMRVNESGTITNHSDIRMRRLPPLSKAQLDRVREVGQRIAEKLNAS